MTRLIITLLCLLMFQSIFGQFAVQYKPPPQPLQHNNTDTLEIPFLEDWSSGDLETNGWTTNDENVFIDENEGINPPCTIFDVYDYPPEYAYSLTSAVFNATSYQGGDIWLDFDLKLDVFEEDWAELFLIEIHDNTGWHVLFEMENHGSLEWTILHLKLNDYTYGQYFQLRFTAEGNNPESIDNWYIDNINIYRDCKEPESLWQEYIWQETLNRYIEFGIKLHWEAPIESLYHYYLTYAWEQYSGVGLVDGGDFTVAAKWDLSDYPYLSDNRITYIGFALNDENFDYLKAKIWTGSNAEYLLWESGKLNPHSGEPQKIVVDPPVKLDTINYLWIGYRIYGQPPNAFPACTDAGPADVGLGDMISMDEIVWDTLSSYGLDYNWYLGFYSAHISDTTALNLQGFNIYRSKDDSSSFEWLDYVPQVVWQIDHDYFDKYANVEIGRTYCYKVTSEWVFGQDSCESNPARSMDYPFEDFVCELVTTTDAPTFISEISIFPNPVNKKLFIQSEDRFKQLTLFNNLGHKIEVIQLKETGASIDVSGLNSGIYFLQIEAENGIEIKKVVVSH